MWIDTHCHLDAEAFAADRDAVLARARDAGVSMLVIPAVEVSGFAAAAELAHRCGCAYALGIHPLYTPQADDGARTATSTGCAWRWSRPATTRGWSRSARSGWTISSRGSTASGRSGSTLSS